MLVPCVRNEALFEFVVAAEQGEGGMVADAFQIVDEFRFDVGHEGFIEGRIGGAGEDEILPDEHAETVAGVEEIVLFVEAAAPCAEEVHVGVCGVADEAVVVGLREARDEIVGGNPVGAFREERLAVDGELEGFAPFVRMAVEFEFAEADFDGPFVEKVAVGVQQFGDDEIAVLRAEAVGPPELRILDGKRNWLVSSRFRLDGHGVLRFVQRGGGDVQLEAVGGGRRQQLRFHDEIDGAVCVVFLFNQHAVDSRGLDGQQLDIAEDAACGGHGAPVPAEGAGHLAQPAFAAVERREAVPAWQCLFGKAFFAFLHAVRERDDDGVDARLQHGFDVRFPCAEHVVRFDDRLAVDGDGGDGVQAFATEDDLVRIRQKIRIHLEIT